jgi:uncharacterized protein
MFKDRFRFCLTLALLSTGTSAGAASFECKAARSKVETMICQDSGLSTLDEQLNEVYAQFRTTGRGRSEKSTQIAWLDIRESCQDQACLRRAYEARIAELQARLASNSPFVGFWKKVYPCDGAVGIYEDRCKRGERDVFTLDIAIHRNRVCVSHTATGLLGNRVDGGLDAQPSMTGKIKDKVATVRFRSRWGGAGTASMRVEAGKLHWKVLAKNKGESGIPDEGVLVRVPAGPYHRLTHCQE